MSLKSVFPTYPILLVSLPGSDVKFGTRRVYVDLPWQIYLFYTQALSNLNAGRWKAEDVKEKWLEFLEKNREKIKFRGKPIANVSLRITSSAKKPFLQINVNWDLFIDYLEDKSKKLLQEVMKDGNNILKVYEQIWLNFFLSIGEIRPFTYVPAKIENYKQRENFIKLLRRTKDVDHINSSLEKLQSIVTSIESFYEDSLPMLKIYTVNILMNIRVLDFLVRNGGITAAYVLLRKILESLVKIYIYIWLGKVSKNPNLVLAIMSLYGYRAYNRTHSFKKFLKEEFKKYMKIEEQIAKKEQIDGLEFLNKLQEKGMRKPGIGKNFLIELANEINLNGEELANLYSACSEIIHNQNPLPFYSLLEVKFFKHFLDWFISCIYSIAIILLK